MTLLKDVSYTAKEAAGESVTLRLRGSADVKQSPGRAEVSAGGGWRLTEVADGGRVELIDSCGRSHLETRPGESRCALERPRGLT